MVYLLLSILSSTIIAIIFKVQDRLGIKLFPVIVVNYIVATTLGLLVLQEKWQVRTLFEHSWLITALAVGVLLILGFFVIGLSIQKAGISVTIVASKMSVVIPILFSIIAFDEQITTLKVIGLVLAVIGIVLTVYPDTRSRVGQGQLLLPLLIFFILGMIDSLVKLGQTQVDEQLIPLFTAVSFGISGIIGLIIGAVKYKPSDFWRWREVLTGVALGLFNWGSMYFIMQALNRSGLDSSVVFGINNIGVISLSVILAFILFRERLSKVNWLGVLVAIAAAWILSSV